MDNQDHRTHHTTTGHESHGGHVCHKCGWPFPNPHPSAKHRRAHKKICGTIEGYKLFDSHETSHFTLSDDEHHSDDEDHKSHSPKVLERSNKEKGSGGIGERSNKSEDDMFSDAVTEFPDSGSGSGIEEHMGDGGEPALNVKTIANNETAIGQSYRDCGEITAITPPPSNLVDGSQMKRTEVSESNLSQSAKGSQDHFSIAAVDLTTKSLVDSRTEESGDIMNASVNGTEAKVDAAQGKGSTVAGNSVEDDNGKVEGNDNSYVLSVPHDMPVVEDVETMIKGFKDHNQGNLLHLVDVDLLEVVNDVKDLEAVLKSGKTQDMTSDPAPAAEVIQLKEEHTDELDSKTSLNDMSLEVKSVERTNASVNGSQIKVDAVQDMGSSGAGNQVEDDNGKEGNDNFYVFSVPHDVPVVENVETLIRGYKDHKGGTLPKFVTKNSLEVGNDVKNSISDDNPLSSDLRILNEGTAVSSSDVHVLEDNIEQSGVEQKDESINKLSVEGLPAEGKSNVAQIKVLENENQRSEESGAETDVGKEMDKSVSFESPEEQPPCDPCKESSPTSSAEHAVKALSDGNPVVPPLAAEVRETTNLPGVDDVKNHETAEIKRLDITINETNKNAMEDSCTENKIATSVPASLLPECEISADQENKIERCNQTGIEAGEGDFMIGSIEDNISTEIKSTVGSATEADVVSQNVIDKSEDKLQEPKCAHLDRISDTHGDIKELESNSKNEVELGCASSVNLAAESDNGHSIEVLQKPTEDHMTREPLVSTLDTSSSVQNSTTVEDSQAKASIVVASGNRSEFLADEGVEVLQKPSEDHMTKEPLVSTLDTSSSVQNSTTVEDSQAKASIVVTSGNRSESLADEGVELLQKPSEDHMTKEPLVSTLDASSSVQNSTTVEDSQAKASIVVVSGNRSESLADEGAEVLQNPSEDHMTKDPLVSTLDTSSSVQNSTIVEDSQAKASIVVISGNRSESLADEGVELLHKPLEDHMTKEALVSTLDVSSVQNSTTVEDSQAKASIVVASGNRSESLADEGVEVLQKPSEDHMTKDPLVSTLDTSSSVQNFTTVEDSQAKASIVASGNKSVSLADEGDNNFVVQQTGASTADFSVDSSSRTDSLEGHWGSVSVLSTQSDISAFVDAEPLPSNGSQASAEVERAKPKAAFESQHSDKLDTFEPPSFMTLVEPSQGADQKAGCSEIQAVQNPQQPQAGWFPSITHVGNDSQGRKKNEEIIAKVTNWSSGKQHTPLKSLLGEANVEIKSKSANPKESPASVVQKDETTAKDNGVQAATVGSVLGPEVAEAKPVKKETAKEWNSPAKYPADIKREKSKDKGRPYWVQFVCCASIN